MTRHVDTEWRTAHPLPATRDGKDKSERGTVLVVAGSSLSPGAGLLTAEAALRVGAGRVQLGTIEPAAASIGAAFPECALLALPVDDGGSIAATALKSLGHHAGECHALVIGPGMILTDQLPSLLEGLLKACDEQAKAVLDAGAIEAIKTLDRSSIRGGASCVITPHHGELVRLMDRDVDRVANDPERAAQSAADRFGVIVVLKDAKTIIAAPGGEALRYVSSAPGLGTAGSGDVLAGAIAGLMARGCPAFEAAVWGVVIHGEAGRLAGIELGEIGYLARELLPRLPRLVSSA